MASMLDTRIDWLLRGDSAGVGGDGVGSPLERRFITRARISCARSGRCSPLEEVILHRAGVPHAGWPLHDVGASSGLVIGKGTSPSGR